MSRLSCLCGWWTTADTAIPALYPQVVEALQRPCGLRLSHRQLRAWSEFRAALYAWDGTHESLRQLLEPTQYLHE